MAQNPFFRARVILSILQGGCFRSLTVSKRTALGSAENSLKHETVNSRTLDELAPNHHRERPYCGSG